MASLNKIMLIGRLTDNPEPPRTLPNSGSTVVNLRAARKFANFEIYGDVLNVLNSRDKDIAYFYESFIPGFDTAPVEGRLSRVVEPRTVRVGATYRF